MGLINNPLVIAHRGASGVAPENTLLAIHTAIASKADFIEIDVQLTRDKEVVLFHDRSLKRIVGKDKSIQDMTLNDLRQLDVGSWKNEQFKNEKIITLQEVLETIDGQSFIVEIKPEKVANPVNRGRKLEERVLEILDDYSGIGDGYISVRDIPTLNWMRDHTTRYRIGLMQKHRSSQELFQLITDQSLDIIQIRSKQFIGDDYDRLGNFDVETYVYWGDGPLDWDYLVNQPIDGILTNYPELLRGYYGLKQVENNYSLAKK